MRKWLFLAFFASMALFSCSTTCKIIGGSENHPAIGSCENSSLFKSDGGFKETAVDFLLYTEKNAYHKNPKK